MELNPLFRVFISQLSENIGHKSAWMRRQLYVFSLHPFHIMEGEGFLNAYIKLYPTAFPFPHHELRNENGVNMDCVRKNLEMNHRFHHLRLITLPAQFMVNTLMYLYLNIPNSALSSGVESVAHRLCSVCADIRHQFHNFSLNIFTDVYERPFVKPMWHDPSPLSPAIIHFIVEIAQMKSERNARKCPENFTFYTSTPWTISFTHLHITLCTEQCLNHDELGSELVSIGFTGKVPKFSINVIGLDVYTSSTIEFRAFAIGIHQPFSQPNSRLSITAYSTSWIYPLLPILKTSSSLRTRSQPSSLSKTSILRTLWSSKSTYNLI